MSHQMLIGDSSWSQLMRVNSSLITVFTSFIVRPNPAPIVEVESGGVKELKFVEWKFHVWWTCIMYASFLWLWLRGVVLLSITMSLRYGCIYTIDTLPRLWFFPSNKWLTCDKVTPVHMVLCLAQLASQACYQPTHNSSTTPTHVQCIIGILHCLRYVQGVNSWI